MCDVQLPQLHINLMVPLPLNYIRFMHRWAFWWCMLDTTCIHYCISYTYTLTHEYQVSNMTTLPWLCGPTCVCLCMYCFLCIAPVNNKGTVPITILCSYSYRGNRLIFQRQLVGQTVNSEAMATDAVTIDVKYKLNVSHWQRLSSAICKCVYVCVCACAYVCMCVYMYVA